MKYKLRVFALILLMVGGVGCSQTNVKNYSVQEIVEPHIGYSFMYLQEEVISEYDFDIHVNVMGFNFKSPQVLDYIHASVGFESSTSTYYNSPESQKNISYLENVRWADFLVIPDTKLLIKPIDGKIVSKSFIYWFDKTDREVLRLNTLDELYTETIDFTLKNDSLLKEISKNIAPRIKESNDLEYSIELRKQDSDFSFDNIIENTVNAPIKKTDFSIGESFDFGELTLTFSNVSSWTKVDNRFSDLNQKSVFILPINVLNNNTKKDNLNMFSYEIYGPNGAELDSVSSYFDGNIDFFGDLLPSASADSFIPVLYDGDGEYKIYFENYSEELTLTFNVSR